jgi:hypothetical protein
MKFLNILNYPNELKQRNNNEINPVSIFKIDKSGTTIDIVGHVKSIKDNKIWIPNILFLDNKITQNTKILIDCNCFSFMYEFYFHLYKNDALKYPNKLTKEQLKYGKKSLTVLSGCKHVIGLSRVIQHNIGRINNMKENIVDKEK